MSNEQEHLEQRLVDFKLFMNKHPKLIELVRRNPDFLQTFFERWASLGPADPYWEKLVSKHSPLKQTSREILDEEGVLKTFWTMIEKINVDTLDKQLDRLEDGIKFAQAFISHVNK